MGYCAFMSEKDTGKPKSLTEAEKKALRRASQEAMAEFRQTLAKRAEARNYGPTRANR